MSGGLSLEFWEGRVMPLLLAEACTTLRCHLASVPSIVRPQDLNGPPYFYTTTYSPELGQGAFSVPWPLLPPTSAAS